MNNWTSETLQKVSNWILNELYYKGAINKENSRVIDPEWNNYKWEEKKVGIEVLKTKWLIIEVLEYFENDDVSEWVIIENEEWYDINRVFESYYLSEKWIKLIEEQIKLLQRILDIN